MKNGKIFKVIGVVVFVLGFIGGIVGGSVLKIPAEYSYRDPTFNWGLMLSFFAGSFISGMVFLWLGTMLEHTEQIKHILNKMNAPAYTPPLVKSPPQHTQSANTSPMHISSDYNTRFNADQPTWICKKCGTKNLTSKSHCKNCGEYK